MSSNILTIVVVLATSTFFILYKFYAAKDVNELYLEQQSAIDTTRAQRQSAIYKSNMLSYTGYLRTGLEIRYEVYKLRNGNLRDIWSLAMTNSSSKKMVFNDKTTTYHELNHKLKTIGAKLAELHIATVGINVGLFESLDVWTFVLACFVNNITIHHTKYPLDGIDLMVTKASALSSIPAAIKSVLLLDNEDDEYDLIDENRRFYGFGDFSGELQEDSVYINKYSKQNDMGVVVKSTVNYQTVDYSHQNFVSAVASASKHLPTEEQMSEKDMLLLIPDESRFQFNLNDWIKIMTCFLVGCEVNIQTKSDVMTAIQSINPTILSLNESLKSTLTSTIDKSGSFKFNQAYQFFCKGKAVSFGQIVPNRVRMVYLASSIDSHITTSELNRIRAAFGSKLVHEKLVAGIIGPLTLTNVYDYRLITSRLDLCGAPSQSLEIKLINKNDENDDGRHGEINVRGYTIGKKDSRDIEHQNDGFMPIAIEGKWGNDGCLYRG